ALEGIARNPGSSDKIMTPMIIGLALIESLAIYGLLIAFMLLGKIA
ncbi:MAG: ATP synthase F0 subunit C, partial [SAR324 cluster bacterium]|nr:ATP synthase F0 subunit C [SAR324 cluster bacterium]